MRLTEAEQKSFRKMFVYLEYCLHVLRGKLGMPQPEVPPQPTELVRGLLDHIHDMLTNEESAEVIGYAESWLAEQEEVSDEPPQPKTPRPDDRDMWSKL